MTRKNVVGLSVIPIFVLLSLFLLLGDNLEIIKSAFNGDHSAAEIRAVLSELGVRGQVTPILAMLQVLLMFLLAEPVQMIGGLTFGFKVGFLPCLIGVALANTTIYLLYKLLGSG